MGRWSEGERELHVRKVREIKGRDGCAGGGERDSRREGGGRSAASESRKDGGPTGETESGRGEDPRQNTQVLQNFTTFFSGTIWSQILGFYTLLRDIIASNFNFKYVLQNTGT